MSPDKLVTMANQIAGFFHTQPNEDPAAGVAGHINSFWEPRMRRELLAIIDGETRSDLDEAVVGARDLIRKPPEPADA